MFFGQNEYNGIMSVATTRMNLKLIAWKSRTRLKAMTSYGNGSGFVDNDQIVIDVDDLDLL